MKVTVGMKFNSLWFKGIVEVLSVDEPNNLLNVIITPPSGMAWPEKWNLQHTQWGFEKGEYKLAEPLTAHPGA